MPKIKLTQKIIDNLISDPVEKADQFLWDQDCLNLAIRQRATGEPTYVFQYKDDNARTRRMLIGKVSAIPLVEARKKARQLHADIVNGLDPASTRDKKRKELTVAELCDRYLLEGAGHKKTSTRLTDVGRIERHIKPLLGSYRITAVTLGMVERFMRDIAEGTTRLNVKTRAHGRAIVKGGRGTASRTVGLLGGIFTYAKRQGFIQVNPVHGVRRPKDMQRGVLLTREQLGHFLECLKWLSTQEVNPVAVNLIKLIFLTGRRRGEVEMLTWSSVRWDLGQLWLSDTKTGALKVDVSSMALKVIEDMKPYEREGNPYVFPAINGDGYYIGLPKVWSMVRKFMQMPELRIHDLRHNFASWLVLSKVPVPVISKLLGHRDPRTTGRYLHLDAEFTRSASESVGQLLLTPGHVISHDDQRGL